MNKLRKFGAIKDVSTWPRAMCLVAGMPLAAGYGPANAAGIMDNGMYFGVQAAQFTYEQDDVPDIEPTALVFRVGYMASDNFGIEGRAGGGMSGDDADFEFFGDANLDVEIENIFGVYAVGRLPLNERFSIYGLAGVSSISVDQELESSIASGSASEDESGVSLGGGVDIGLTDKFSLTVEFMAYLPDGDEFEMSAFSIGVQF